MKVRCVVTVDIDEEAWALNYGTTGSIRQDVQQYVYSLVTEQLRDVEVTKPPERNTG